VIKQSSDLTDLVQRSAKSSYPFSHANLDGVYIARGASARFHRLNEPSSGELSQLAPTLAHRVRRFLERQGWLEHDAENDQLALDTADDDPLRVLQGHSISYRIALGPQAN
jgi:hypothetical protein